MQPVSTPAVLTPPSRPPTLAGNASYLCTQVSKAATRSLVDGLAAHDIRPAHFAVLSALHDLGASSQQELCDALDIDKAHMCGFVDDLLTRELVARERDEEDRRRYRVTLTGAGRTLLDDLDRIEAQTQQEVFGELSPDDHDTLITLLSRVVAAADVRRLADD